MANKTTLQNWEIIAACERWGIMPDDHWEVVQLIQWGKIENRRFGNRLRLPRYRDCINELMRIINAHAKQSA